MERRALLCTIVFMVGLSVLIWGLWMNRRVATASPQRFIFKHVAQIGDNQKVYVIRDSATNQCVLVVEVSPVNKNALGVTSQPWPCD